MEKIYNKYEVEAVVNVINSQLEHIQIEITQDTTGRIIGFEITPDSTWVILPDIIKDVETLRHYAYLDCPNISYDMNILCVNIDTIIKYHKGISDDINRSVELIYKRSMEASANTVTAKDISEVLVKEKVRLGYVYITVSGWEIPGGRISVALKDIMLPHTQLRVFMKDMNRVCEHYQLPLIFDMDGCEATNELTIFAMTNGHFDRFRWDVQDTTDVTYRLSYYIKNLLESLERDLNTK